MNGLYPMNLCPDMPALAMARLGAVSRPLVFGRFALGAALALLIGCGDSDVQLSSAPVGECVTTDQCGIGLACIANTCVRPELPDLIAVEITPAGNSSFVRTQFLDIPVAGSFDFSLREPTDYEVEILDANGASVSANLTLFGPDGIPGRERSVDQFFTATGPQPMRLLPGIYSVIVQPADAPGMEVVGFSVRMQPTPVSKVFQLPERYRRLYGTVRSARSNQIRLAGFRVRAFGLRSGLASTTTVTDASGYFEIRLPDSTETFFRLEADPPADLRPTWSFRQIVRVEDERARDIEMTLVRPEDQGTVRLQVVGIDLDGIPQPVDNARVTLTATVTGFEIPPAFEVTGTTDVEGRVRIDGQEDRIPLIRARYLVDVQPPSNSTFRRTSSVLDLTGAGRGFSLDEQVPLVPRTEVIRTVRTAGGQPLAGALVSFEPTTTGLVAQDVVTASDGRLSVRLDPGIYRMVVEPLRGRVADELLPVADETVDIRALAVQPLAPFIMPVGIEVEGTVRGSDGTPEVGARATLFLVDDKNVKRLGEGVTDDRGRFTAVIGLR